MNYTLKQLQQRVNKLIEQQGEDAYCGAWIYTKEDCFMTKKQSNGHSGQEGKRATKQDHYQTLKSCADSGFKNRDYLKGM